MIDRYLVDTVTLTQMSVTQRGCAFMRAYCRIPEEILYEAGGMPDIDTLSFLDYPVTAAVMEKAKEVLNSITPKDRVVDLYSNKGNGDVMLLATALAEIEVSAGQLIGDRWIIATADVGLTKKAAELHIPICHSKVFIALTA